MSKFACYGAPGSLERGFSPYRVRALGQAPASQYSLTPPVNAENLREFKRALYELGKLGADPLLSKPEDLIKETFWKRIDPSTNFWEPSLSDELVMFISRFRKWGEDELDLELPYMQLINELGPKPTVATLRLLAAVLRARTGGAVTMARFEAWFGQSGEPDNGTVDAFVLPPPWFPRCTQIPYDDTKGSIPANVAKRDEELVEVWNAIISDPEIKAEGDRTAWAQVLELVRGARNSLARAECFSDVEANCWATGGIWSKSHKHCIGAQEQCTPPRVWKNGRCYDPAIEPVPVEPAPAFPPPGPVPAPSGPRAVNVWAAVLIAAAATLGVRWALASPTRRA